jgi:tetratricopeptide (TPR) repeat protein
MYLNHESDQVIFALNNHFKLFVMKKSVSSFFIFVIWVSTALAQREPLSIPNIGGNKKASISEYIGLCEVIIRYHRPGVKGREGKIWGKDLAHYGFQDLGFGSSKASPWRAGANENTLISFSKDVKIEGKPLAAGTYGLSMALGETETTVIFSKETNAWGSYFYDEKNDALRTTVKNAQNTDGTSRDNREGVEWLKYDFLNQTDNSAMVALMWEKWKIGFVVEVDLLKTQFETYVSEMKMPKGFSLVARNQATAFCLENNYQLEQGLKWANDAVGFQKSFQTLNTKASILKKMGKATEADATMKEAMLLANTTDLHGYARSLLGEKRAQDAFNIFKMNYDKTPNVYTTNVGLIRGYSALGNYKKAVEYAKMALPQAPDDVNKNSIEKMIKTLEAGKDVN